MCENEQKPELDPGPEPRKQEFRSRRYSYENSQLRS